MELAEKLEEAFVAYLKSLTTWPVSLQTDPADASTLRIFPGENDDTKNAQCIVCVADDSGTEEPPNSGNRMFPFRCEVRTPVVDPSPLASHKALAALLETAIQNTVLADLVNAAAYAKAIAEPEDFAELDNFCLYPVISRTPTRAQDEEMHVSGQALSCYAMGIKG